MALVAAFIDMPQPVSHKPGDQTDTELQDKGLRGIYYIDRIEKIPNGHADGSAQTAVKAAQDQGAQHTDRISQMNGGGISAGKGNLDLQKGKYYIGKGCKKSGHGNL